MVDFGFCQQLQLQLSIKDRHMMSSEAIKLAGPEGSGIAEAKLGWSRQGAPAAMGTNLFHSEGPDKAIQGMLRCIIRNCDVLHAQR